MHAPGTPAGKQLQGPTLCLNLVGVLGEGGERKDGDGKPEEGKRQLIIQALLRGSLFSVLKRMHRKVKSTKSKRDI